MALSLAGCIPIGEGVKGEDFLGDFSFVASAVSDTCLASRFQPSLTFPASLSKTKDVLYFSGPSGSTINGTIVGQTFTVGFGGNETIDRLCTVSRDETITATLDGDRRLTGNYLIRVIPQTGSNCTAAVLTRQFATLPCSVSYQLVAERTDWPDAGTGEDGGAGDGGAEGGAEDGGTTDGGAP